MKLLTATIRKALPAIGMTANLQADAVAVPLKVFNPMGGQTWFITELDETEGQAFGYVTGMGHDELGYIDFSELQRVKGRLGLPMERDLHWDPKTTLAQVMAGARS